jgi:hypothetical protein
MFQALIICAAIGLAGLIMLLVDRDRWSACVLPLYYLSFSILTVIYPDTEDTPGWKPYRIFYVLLVVFSVMHMLHKSGSSRFSLKSILWIPYVAIVIDYLLSVIYTSRDAFEISDSSHGLMGYLVVVGLYWIAATQFQRKRDVHYFIWATVLCALLTSLWVIQAAWRVGFSEARAGLEVNQIYVVEFIAIGIIPLIDFSFVCRKGLPKRITLVAILISMYGVYLTGSRGAMLGIAAATTAIAWKYGSKNNRKQSLRTFVGIAVVCAIVFFLPGDENVLQRILNNSAPSQAVEARYIIWPFLLVELASRDLLHWLIGDGMNSSLVVLRSTFDIGWGDPHNMYLQTLCDQGIIGLGLFVFFLHSIKKRLARASESLGGNLYYGWFIYLIVAGLFEVEANGKLFWILLGVIAGSYAMETVGVHSKHDSSVPVRNLPTLESAQDGAEA